MKIGFGAPIAGAWSGPESLARFAARAEQLHYHALWTYQRLLIPEDASKIPPSYHSVLDPLLSLAYAAAHTSRIRLGVALINLPFISPTYLAKEAATLDVLSGGRLDLGLGIGWEQEEFTATGASMRRRAARTVEYLKVLHTLWNDEVSEFGGEFYTVPPSRMAPKPVQRPGPPVLLGGMVRPALARAGRIADGWLLSWTRSNIAQLGEQIEVVRASALAAGKDPAAVRIVCRGVVDAGVSDRSTERPPLSGSFSQIRADAEWLAEQGVTELFYELNHNPRFGAPDADAAAATERAAEILESLAPGRTGVTG